MQRGGEGRGREEGSSEKAVGRKHMGHRRGETNRPGWRKKIGEKRLAGSGAKRIVWPCFHFSAFGQNIWVFAPGFDAIYVYVLVAFVS